MIDPSSFTLSLLRSRLTCKETDEKVEWMRSLAVGRDPRSDLVLRLAQVSGRHAAVEWRDGAWQVPALRSRHGPPRHRRQVAGGQRGGWGGRGAPETAPPSTAGASTTGRS